MSKRSKLIIAIVAIIFTACVTYLYLSKTTPHITYTLKTYTGEEEEPDEEPDEETLKEREQFKESYKNSTENTNKETDKRVEEAHFDEIQKSVEASLDFKKYLNSLGLKEDDVTYVSAARFREMVYLEYQYGQFGTFYAETDKDGNLLQFENTTNNFIVTEEEDNSVITKVGEQEESSE